MAYGQTGSGKTHTIFGSTDSIQTMTSQYLHDEIGLVPRIVDSLFNYLELNTEKK